MSYPSDELCGSSGGTKDKIIDSETLVQKLMAKVLLSF